MKFVYFIFCAFIFHMTSVTSFSWQSCGDIGNPVKIQSLDVVSSKKVIYVSGRGKVALNITSPFQAEVKMYKKYLWTWIEIPCVDDIGSCFYKNVCEMSPYKNQPCPAVFEDNQIPCKCPILQGQYVMKKVPINLNFFSSWIESGNYRLRVKFQENDTELLCLLMYITL